MTSYVLQLTATFVLQKDTHAVELEETYYRPESSEIGPAGSFSEQRLTYPVSRGALAEYLEHQPQSALNALMRRSAHRAPIAPAQQQRTDPALVAPSTPTAQAAQGRALSDYLQHQRQRVRKRLESRAERGRLHLLAAAKRRSVAQQLALAILGQNAANAAADDDRPPPPPDRSGGPASAPPPPAPAVAPAADAAAQEGRIMHVVQLLQREIALDTKARPNSMHQNIIMLRHFLYHTAYQAHNNT
jgi:hypothetical protein